MGRTRRLSAGGKSLRRVTNIRYYSLNLTYLRGVDCALMVVLVELRMIE